jgi:hypothetical protein
MEFFQRSYSDKPRFDVVNAIRSDRGPFHHMFQVLNRAHEDLALLSARPLMNGTLRIYTLRHGG